MNKAILQIVCLVSVFLFVAINVLTAAHAEDTQFLSGTNATDIEWGLEFKDDNLEEDEEKEDECEHAEEEKDRN